jgi:hypothetical protein
MTNLIMDKITNTNLNVNRKVINQFLKIIEALELEMLQLWVNI